MTTTLRSALGLLGALACACLPAASRADRDIFRLDSPAYRSECGSCHVAYPPQLLPGESWRALMGGLGKHFGADASLDANTAREIESYLEANAGRARRDLVKPPLRITQTAWFRDEHDELPQTVWTSPAVKSPANCSACHTRAQRGDFSERTLRVPK